MARGSAALDFAIGRRRIELPEPIDSWIHANAELSLKQAGAADIKAFTEAAADLLRREYDADVAAAHILPTPGGRAAISAFVACVMEPGDDVLVTEPGYPAFARLASHRHANIREAILDPDNAFVPDVKSALDATAPAPRVIALNYPNNPTGAILSQDTTEALRRVAGEKTILFNDATYGPLVYDSEPTSLLSGEILKESHTELIELHSISKLFPVGPIAVSFLAGSAATMHSIATYSEFAWSPLSALQLKATTMCLQDAARLRELREFFPRQLGQLRQTLVDVGFDPYPTPSGVYTICRTPPAIGGKTTSTAAAAAEIMMDDFDLAVVPWDTPQHSYLRFSSLYHAEDLERLAKLRESLQLG